MRPVPSARPLNVPVSAQLQPLAGALGGGRDRGAHRQQEQQGPEYPHGSIPGVEGGGAPAGRPSASSGSPRGPHRDSSATAVESVDGGDLALLLSGFPKLPRAAAAGPAPQPPLSPSEPAATLCRHALSRHRPERTPHPAAAPATCASRSGRSSPATSTPPTRSTGRRPPASWGAGPRPCTWCCPRPSSRPPAAPAASAASTSAWRATSGRGCCSPWSPASCWSTGARPTRPPARAWWRPSTWSSTASPPTPGP